MQQLNEETGTAFLFATHDPRVMSYARRIVRMVDGKIIDDGNGGAGLIMQPELAAA